MKKNTMTFEELAGPTVVRVEMRRAIGAITGKWKLEILWHLNRRTHRFGELRSIPGIAQHILTAQLRELEADGLVSRKILAEVPPRVEYSITPAVRALKPVMDALFSWWEEFGPSPEGANDGR